jgi:hypothetical protein
MNRSSIFTSGLRTCLAPAVIFLLAAGSVFAQAPALGDVARKEQDRRKALPPATKVYTNKDLPAEAVRPEGAAPAERAGEAAPAPTAPAAPDAAPPAKAEEPAKADEEATWRKRIADAREELRRNEMFAEALQTRINALSRDALSRDDPAARRRVADDRNEARAELARVKQAIEAGTKQIADTEEEARKAGVPPGWLR